MRQKPPVALMDARGGRGRRVRTVARPEGWRMPPLPPGVTAPLADPVQARYQPLALRHARTVWREWWHSQPALAVDPGSDLEAISWWIVCVFRRALYLQVVRERPLVKGSTGQPVSNPLERVIGGLTEDINRAEERFGMDTLSRFRLAFEPVREERTWQPDHAEIDRWKQRLQGDGASERSAT